MATERDFPTIRRYTVADAQRLNYMMSARPDSWLGSTAEEYATLLRDGDLSAVAASDALLSRIETDLDVSGLRRELVPAVVGPVANVPAYLAGIPESMLAFEQVESDRGEITVLADMFISASFDPSAYRRRGVALLALVRALSIVRPVRLFALVAHERGKNRHGCVVELPSNPLDLATCGFWLAHVSAFRQFGLAETFHYMEDATTQHGFRDMTEAESVAWLAGQLDLDRDNVILSPGMVSGDGTAPFKTDAGAVDWVQGRINAALA